MPVSFSLELDDSLKLADGETYQVVRTHDGVNEVVDSTYDAATNTVTVSSDKFSEFSLIKTSADATTTPKTGDGAQTGASALGILAGAAALAFSAHLRRNA